MRSPVLSIIAFSFFMGISFLIPSSQSASKGADTPIFARIYSDIFYPSCSLAGCHDGSFEPDFRTLQSSYSTLVLHPLIKNNREASYTYRVVPYDTAASVLFERVTNCCFVDVQDRMPFYDKEGLSRIQINLIADWISQGAPNIFGEIPAYHCSPPEIVGIHLFGVDKKGEKTPVGKKIVNDLGEPVELEIERSFAQIHCTLDIVMDWYTCPEEKLNGYELVIYRDDSYSHPLQRVKASLSISRPALEVSIPMNALPSGELVFIRIENKDLDSFVFPGVDMQPHLRHQWAIRTR